MDEANAYSNADRSTDERDEFYECILIAKGCRDSPILRKFSEDLKKYDRDRVVQG